VPLRAVKGSPTKEDKEDAALDTIVRFRAYHNGSATAKPTRTIREWRPGSSNANV
jgi:hypothetical protein